MTDEIAILPMDKGGSLTADQSRRATCLALTLSLLRGRNVHVGTVREIAAWLYDGSAQND